MGSTAETDENPSLATVSKKEKARNRILPIVQPTVNGLRTLALNKWGLTQAIKIFTDPPDENPYAACFHFPGAFLSHRYVLDVIKAKVGHIHDMKVESLTFTERNVFFGATGLDNRWIVEFNTTAARDELVKQGVEMYNRKMVVRRYDEILQFEYREFIEFLKRQDNMYESLVQNKSRTVAETDEISQFTMENISYVISLQQRLFQNDTQSRLLKLRAEKLLAD